VNRVLVLGICLGALILGWFAYAHFSTQPAVAASSGPLTPKIENSRIYFVPLGGFPTEQITPLVDYYHRKYSLEIQVLPDVTIDSSSMDSQRQQLVAERLLDGMRLALPTQADDPHAILIGFTSQDIYPASMGWQFAFGWRQGNVRAAVVSTSRMTLHYPGEPVDLDLSDTRLRKVVSKDVGLLYYGLPQSRDPKSVLYNQIMGIEELDGVGEDF
jgi:predicted Zn-dependent protease